MIKVNDEVIDFKRFNDGSLRLKYDLESSRQAIVTWLYDSDSEISDLYFLVKHLQAVYHLNLTLIMPYVANARMDRVKEKSECFTLKYFCEFINSLNFYSVRIFDPHSRVAPALLNNVEMEMPTRIIEGILNSHPYATLCFPDTGAQEKYSKLFNDDIYFAFGVKDREWTTQKIRSLQIMGAKHMIAGHDILLCDDILSRGSTIYLAAAQLKEMGANNIYVWVSHCENTVLGPHINGRSLLDYDLITKIYTTNSIYRSTHPKIEVIHTF